ncbi:hypothetical protein AAF712_014752 [Marasmius tenuissimus]|uniref:Uncharacterized protein n=1 Tax=Marasmius tenuissimus TaxID=585030 RepID=A0ABR2ZA64_9AGAR
MSTIIMNLTSEETLADALKQWSSHPVLVKLYKGNLGQEDAQYWLRHIDRQCDRYGISSEQRIQAALHFMRGSVHDVFSDAVRTLEEEGEELSWDDFKQTLLELEATSKAQLAGSQDTTLNKSESESKSKNRLIARMTGGGLIAGGSSVLLPTAGLATLNAVGFTSSGVAAGSLAAGLQSAVYGGATGGLFSICQSIGATAVVAPPVVIALGAGAVAAGVGCVVANRVRSRDQSEINARDDDKK